MINTIFKVSDEVKNNRSVQSILNSAVSEVGELATEVDIKFGVSYKSQGPDGIIGEAIDVILGIVDLIHVYDPTLTEADLIDIATIKLAKWKSKVEENQ